MSSQRQSLIHCIQDLCGKLNAISARRKQLIAGARGPHMFGCHHRIRGKRAAPSCFESLLAIAERYGSPSCINNRRNEAISRSGLVALPLECRDHRSSNSRGQYVKLFNLCFETDRDDSIERLYGVRYMCGPYDQANAIGIEALDGIGVDSTGMTINE
jgi:hypothetical protein